LSSQTTIFADYPTIYTARQLVQQVQQALQVDPGNNGVGFPEQTCFEHQENQGYVGLFHQQKANKAWDTIKYWGEPQIEEVSETKLLRVQQDNCLSRFSNSCKKIYSNCMHDQKYSQIFTGKCSLANSPSINW
jgi:gamma-glutamyl-gamma-aminobutyrate hydrolase PuuD